MVPLRNKKLTATKRVMTTMMMMKNLHLPRRNVWFWREISDGTAKRQRIILFHRENDRHVTYLQSSTWYWYKVSARSLVAVLTSHQLPCRRMFRSSDGSQTIWCVLYMTFQSYLDSCSQYSLLFCSCYCIFTPYFPLIQPWSVYVSNLFNSSAAYKKSFTVYSYLILELLSMVMTYLTLHVGPATLTSLTML